MNGSSECTNLLGVVEVHTVFILFTDNRPPGMVPAKAAYMGKDIKRLREYYQVPLNSPSVNEHLILELTG